MTPLSETTFDEVTARRLARQRQEPRTSAPEPSARPGHATTREHAAALEDALKPLLPTLSEDTRARVAQTLAEAVCRIEPISSQAKYKAALEQRDDALAVIDAVRDLCRTPVRVVIAGAIGCDEPFGAVSVVAVLAEVGGDR